MMSQFAISLKFSFICEAEEMPDTLPLVMTFRFVIVLKAEASEDVESGLPMKSFLFVRCMLKQMLLSTAEAKTFVFMRRLAVVDVKGGEHLTSMSTEKLSLIGRSADSKTIEEFPMITNDIRSDFPSS